MDSKTDGLRLLALDGGGTRGLSELLILDEIMKRIQAAEYLTDVPKPCEYFDMIGGTSTGGLNAILLGRLCLSVEQAINVYNKFAGRVYSERKWIWQDGMFKASTLVDEVKSIVARYDESRDGDAHMMSDVSRQRDCKIFVCAMSTLNMAHPCLFRSYPVRANQGYNATIWEAVRATSAAPTFFKRISVGTAPKEEFVDGGLRCNNPTDELFREAQSVYGRERAIACIMSIGAGHPRMIALRKPKGFQRLFWTKLLKALVAIAEDCEELSNKFEEKYGVGRMERKEKTYFRLNVQQGMQDVGLEEWMKMGEVKSHTVQYMLGAAVTVEIDKVKDVLKGPHAKPKCTTSSNGCVFPAPHILNHTAPLGADAA
ncbi:hypothetical protein C0995_000596 [Termitomyces sp. Mi166|nr:hypothetical protein C0995_000596 [Termitomyces sp. Mi166\